MDISLFSVEFVRAKLPRSVVAIKDDAKPDAVMCMIIVFLERTLRLICWFWNRRGWKENRKCFTSDDRRPSSGWWVLKISFRELVYHRMCEEFANTSNATENGFSWLACKLELVFDYVVATSRTTDITSVLLTCFCWVLSRFYCYENRFHSSVVDVRLEGLTTETEDSVFWGSTSCSLAEVYRRFRKFSCLHL
jgi:hypothetical protein